MKDQNNPGSPALTSRRDFLKTTTVVGGTLLSGLSIERSAHAAGDDTLRIALIGGGGRGSRAGGPALSTAGNTKQGAMGHAFPERPGDRRTNPKKQHSGK